MSLNRSLLAASALTAFVFVAACSSLPNISLGGASEKKAAATAEERAGRITMVLADDKLEASPDLAGQTIEIPAAAPVGAWPQAGGSADKSLGHVDAGAALQVDWRKSIGQGSTRKSALATPPVSDGNAIYTLDAGQSVMATELASGRTLWRQTLKGVSKRDKTGLGGGLAVEGGTLVVASGYGHITALDAATGAQKWQRALGSPMTGAPTIKDGRIFAGSNNNELFALDLATGETLWSDQAIAESARVLSSPSAAAVEDFVIAPYSSGEIIAYRATNGRRLWTDAIAKQGRFTPISEINDIGSRPVLASGAVFASSQAGVTVAIDGRSGTRIWDQTIGSAQAPALVGNTLFVVGQDARLAALKAEDGKAYWVKDLAQYRDEKKKKNRISYAGPLIASNRIILVSSAGNLLAFDPQTGEQTASVKLGGAAFLEPVAAGGKLIVLTDDGKLIALR